MFNTQYLLEMSSHDKYSDTPRPRPSALLVITCLQCGRPCYKLPWPMFNVRIICANFQPSVAASGGGGGGVQLLMIF